MLPMIAAPPPVAADFLRDLEMGDMAQEGDEEMPFIPGAQYNVPVSNLVGNSRIAAPPPRRWPDVSGKKRSKGEFLRGDGPWIFAPDVHEVQEAKRRLRPTGPRIREIFDIPLPPIDEEEKW